MTLMTIQTAITEADIAMKAIRKAVDNDKPRVALRDDLDDLDASTWRERAEELEAEASILEEAAEMINEYVEVAERVVQMYSDSSHFPQSTVDALEDQFLTLADDAQLSEWGAQAGEIQEKATDCTTRAEAATNFADAIDAAVDAIDEWEGAEGRDEKADARESLVEVLGELVENFTTMQTAFEGYEEPWVPQ